MIKFWKSAAKGKTGCPVRPPESTPCSSSSSSDPAFKSLIESQTVDENEDNSDVFKKKSKLSLNLHDILVEKKCLKYFIQFMETIGKQTLIKCWLELDNFKDIVINRNSKCESDQAKLNKTKSFDLDYKCNNVSSQRFSWRENSDTFSASSDMNVSKKDFSTNSCWNLSDYNKLTNCETCESKSFTNPTEEAISLFKKYVALEAPCRLELPDSLRKSVISNICHPEGQIKEDCFKSVQDVVYNQIEMTCYNEFVNSPFYVKVQIDTLTDGSLNLQDILYNETILFYFTEYLEQENCRVLLEFLMAVMIFRDNLMSNNATSPDQAQEDAIILYDKYFSLQATNPIGFSTEIRLKIESDICREGGPLPTCFDWTYLIVFKTLTKYVKMFFESEVYYKYLSEMINSVDHTWSSKHKSHSDCSSEYSVSTQNTLLAMGDPVYRKKKRNHSVPDMTIDSNQLYNADALWQRKKHDGLILGRINSLGRFESKFEPDPDKKDRSVLKKMVSRFVPTTTSRVEEEMAWQVAHMIVKDVTDLTMAPPDSENDG